jgi:hypothetical protein
VDGISAPSTGEAKIMLRGAGEARNRAVTLFPA